ncbi:transketolase-like TK C-terminal-containing protein [Candidatus Solirubrobacter pratensis]|uniref:transketolase-like TK C-terminal-containing protein n=1 Tax=Candidatus Solirubrobacter pratensis TaxID=1298857 RepID=UPI00041F9372|nr:1-deoxy-D-xylulose-5-phosphate synthase N-terminal domain-containing protein [Candidatus Solirubrobacter pratensis]
MALAAEPQLDLQTLGHVERRVLWLATSLVHHANRVRENRSGVKVGGHQASSASMVSLMTALYFAHLEAPDRVSVKPHASPVLHAINHLLGRLDKRYLTTLREYGGLQSYPSRTKDPDPVDYSTGSVGLGATAPIWGALAHRYVAGHFDVPVGGRQIALIGDAELDEGACWEAIADPMVSKLGEVMWVVDLNRQSLDRVVPDIAAGRLASMFEAAGWHTVMVKYGPRLQRRPALRARIDAMPNEEYQRLLRADAPQLRERLEVDVSDLEDAELLATFRDLGGHDLATLIDGYRQADAVRDRPSVVFAYTIKGWRLPTEGHPANHSALLTPEQYRELAQQLGEDADDPWRPLEGREADLCEVTAKRLEREPPSAIAPPAVPPDLGREHSGRESTQQAFGRFFVDLAREAPEVAEHVVTVSPDVGTSTNLGGWINKAGIWNLGDRIDWFADDTDTLIRWRESDHGRHIELGIAEVNLVGLLGELGATWSRDGRPLLPVGTIYDPFVARALEPWSFGIYAGGQSILVGTPSGVTLGPEGGAHQSVITPSIGIEQPGCVAYEPAFGQDFEWCFLHALAQLGREGGTSAYFRLSTRPIDQTLHSGTRAEAIAGGYRLQPDESPDLAIAVMGALVPEAVAAADILRAEAGRRIEVVCITSADLLFRSFQARSGLGEGDPAVLERLFRPGVPIVSLLDGHPHTLSFLGGVGGRGVSCLGVRRFGQAGDIAELYEHHQIDAESVVGAALDLLG